MDDFDEAVKFINLAIDATPKGSPNNPILFSRLGELLCIRFEGTGSMDNVNFAIEVFNNVVEATPQDHPDKADRLRSLSSLLE